MSQDSPETSDEASTTSVNASNVPPDATSTSTVEQAAAAPENAAPVNVGSLAAPPTEGTEPGTTKWKPKIAVGSRYGQAGRPGGPRPGQQGPGQRGPGGRPPRPAAPSRSREKSGTGAAEEDATGDKSNATSFSNAPRANVPIPSKREKTNPELEAELDAAMGDMTADQVVDRVTGRAVHEIELESRVQGTVMRLAGDHVFLSLGGRNEGVVSVRQFREPPKLGTELEVVVKSFNLEDGLYELLVPGASLDVSDWSDLTQGGVVEARITGANTGGLECMVNHIRGFIPASQIGLFRVENFADYINQKLQCVVTEANPKRKNLVLSHRAVMEREKEEARSQLLGQLEAGQIYEGVVRSIQDFGAFVDIGGIDGLIHISQLSWDRVQHPSEVVHEGQKVRVKVERVNPQTGKISLSYRELLDRPWDNVEEKFPVGTTVKGPVSRVAKFGAFVKLAPGIEGLIHISELTHGRVRRVEDVLNEGQEVEVKVLSVDPEQQRIALSLKATLPPPEAVQEQAEEEGPPGPARPPAIPRRNRPLRGGLERPSGGDHFGLNW